MATIRRLCVFCGASAGSDPRHVTLAGDVGRGLAERGIGVVYGGGRVGLMGALADAALAAGGEVTGIIPRRLVDRELAHPGLTSLVVVETLHERKAEMSRLADGFIALPGGWGTLEEFFEVLTWAQLGLHRKPCGLLNVCGFFDRLLSFIDHSVDQRFVRRENRSLVLVSHSPDALLELFDAYVPAIVEKWIDRSSS